MAGGGGARGRRGLAIFTAFVATTASVGDARAGIGNDQPYPVGDQASGMGGAAVASVHDGAAPWYNPAGLGRAQAAGVSGSVSAYGLVFEKSKDFYSGGDLNANLGGWVTAVFPAFIGFVKPLDVGTGDGTFRHALGLSVVIPDYERHQVNLSVPETSFSLSAQERLLEQTLWVLPSWGGCVSARLCFGVAFAGAYRSTSGQYSLFLEGATPTNTTVVTASNFQEDTTQFAAAMQGGVQWRATQRWWFGLNVRSPLRSIAGGGTMTVEGTDATQNGLGTPRRYYDTKLWTDYRLPLQVRAGAAYDGESLHVTADVLLSFRQDDYFSERGSGGADIVQPRAKDGAPVGPPFALSGPIGRNTVVNGSVGAQIDLSRKTSLLAGFFTDLSATPKDQIVDELHPRVNRVGLTLGVARHRPRSSTYVTAIVTGGLGESFTFIGKQPRYETAAAFINLGGSSVLDEFAPGETIEKPTSKPLWARWWFWMLLGTAVAGGTAVTIAASTRGTGVPASDLGSQRAAP